MTTKPADFISKLYDILSDQSHRSIISWHEDQFVIKNSNLSAHHILPRYFRHGKLPSFIRQLNLYGFRKIRRSQSKESMYFKHDLFKKGSKQLLPLITLKNKNKGEEKGRGDKVEDIKEVTKRRSEELADLRSNFKSVIQTIYQQLKSGSGLKDEKAMESMFLLKMCGAKDEEPRLYSYPQLLSQHSLNVFLTRQNLDFM